MLKKIQTPISPKELYFQLVALELTTAQRKIILTHKNPEIVKDMQSFLGLINFSRHFIPDYATRTHSLRQLMEDQKHTLDGTHKLHMTLRTSNAH